MFLIRCITQGFLLQWGRHLISNILSVCHELCGGKFVCRVGWGGRTQSSDRGRNM
jgi:hypothetical protein